MRCFSCSPISTSFSRQSAAIVSSYSDSRVPIAEPVGRSAFRLSETLMIGAVNDRLVG